jgi:hypothetical protein
VALCTTAARAASLQGPLTITDTYTSDGNYASASTTQPAIVFSYLARGTFALGDRSVQNATPSTVLTFWADNWASVNKLTGGAAPNAFKGFAPSLFSASGQPTSQLTCGDTFSYNATGGNSTMPPQSLPSSYLAMAVTGKVTKSGSTITGTVPKVVIIHVSPGYSGQPSGHGTGTLVATICG